MTATAPAHGAASPRTRRGGRWRRVARWERPLLAGGLALVALHLLDLAVSGPATTVAGVAAILLVPVAWLALQPRLTRPTRFGLALVAGALAIGFGVVSHGLHVVNSGPDWRDVTGVGMLAGGILLIASGVTALAAAGSVRRSPSASPCTRPRGSAARSSCTCSS